MQLMAQHGLEHGRHAGLGWIEGEVVKLAPADPALKIPHMGWNTLEIAAPHPLLEGIAPGAHAYFVHSFAMRCADPASVIASVDYGGPLVAVTGRDNLVGTQFHPEKSQATGLALLRNFLRWQP
jgi:glutamine amidotransferase